MLFTTHHVLAESVTLIGSRLLPHRAISFARQLLSSCIIRIIRTDEEIEEAALNVYERFNDPGLSYTDCLSFTVMRALGITTSFGFDCHFERAGFYCFMKRGVSQRAIPDGKNSSRRELQELWQEVFHIT